MDLSDLADQRSGLPSSEQRSWEAGSAREAGAVTLLDPTAERDPEGRPLAGRLPAAETDGKTIALLDIRKPRGDVFLDELEVLLAERGYAVHRTAKPTFTKPAPADVRKEIAERCDAVIEALAD